MTNVVFKNPVFHEGQNITCRAESARYDDLNIYQEIKLCDEDFITIDTAELWLIARFDTVKDVPQWLLDKEHDPSCRSHRGLLKELERVYGDWPENSPVLVVGFVV